jgi:hypothetical protein
MGCLETLHLFIQEIPGHFSTLSAPDTNRTIAIGIPSHNNQLAFMAQVYEPKLRRARNCVAWRMKRALRALHNSWMNM